MGGPAINIPKLRAALREIEDLARVQKPLEFLEKLSALIAAALRVDEDQHGCDAGRRNRFYHEGLELLLLRLLLARRLLFWCFP